MRRIFIAVLAVALELAAPARPSAQLAPPVPGFTQTQAWIALARAHEPGQLDYSALAVSRWSLQGQQLAVQDLQLIRMLIAAAIKGGDQAGSGNRKLRINDLPALLDLPPGTLGSSLDIRNLATPDSVVRREISRVMIRVAMLHTDVAMATPEEWAALGLQMRSAPIGAPMAISYRDGRQTFVPDISMQWTIAREAFELVLPTPVGSSLVPLWYRTTTAFLQSRRHYGASAQQLDRARVVFPADAYLQMLSGAVYENMAAPAMQTSIQEAGARSRQSPRELLTLAQRYFTHALELDPSLPASSLRLGRVLDLMGKPDEALEVLQRAEPILTEPAHRYCAALFLGHLFERRGRVEDAARAYERAMALFTGAQTPRLALAHLAWRQSDARQASSGLRTMFTVSGGERTGDPWFVYDVSLVLDVGDRVLALRRAVEEALK